MKNNPFMQRDLVGKKDDKDAEQDAAEASKPKPKRVNKLKKKVVYS